MKKILNFIPNLNMTGHAMCKFCLSIIKDYSKNEITNCGIEELNKYNVNDFDIIHVHQVPQPQFFKTSAKIIYNIHNFILNCPAGGNVCQILNKYLGKPLTCPNCLGYVGMITGNKNMENCINMAKRADRIVVHSDFMREYYHTWDPFVLPLPLQTDLLTPCYEKENFLLYLGRMSFEKNPWGFVEIIERTRFKGKMILYELSEDIANTKSSYKKLLEKINKNNNIELFINPSLLEMIELVKHAKFTVLPYNFIEPYGIAAANSILCNTPLITFPYGNLRSFTNLLPKTLDEMIKIVKMDDKQYQHNLTKTLIKGNELSYIHDPINATKVWDSMYDSLKEE